MAATNRRVLTADWTEQALVRQIAALEASLVTATAHGCSRANWPKFLVQKSLDNRRKLLAAMQRKSW